jgi:hypothetical protein
MVIDCSKVDKEEYLLAMERSLIKDTEIKILLKDALTNEVNVILRKLMLVTSMRAIILILWKNWIINKEKVNCN